MTQIEINTKYGLIKGLNNYSTYEDGSLNECTLNEAVELSTSYGIFIPQYGDLDPRQKDVSCISFFKNGSLKNISLETQTPVTTPIGIAPAEYITFYESGELKRLFPLNGKLSGYWTEEDELQLAENISLSFPNVSFSKKVISLLFYKSGKIKSVTLWPQESVDVHIKQGIVSARTGLSFYENGLIKSLEPLSPVSINTAIGKIVAYDMNAIGVNGDLNSLQFDENGDVTSILTYSNKIKVIDSTGNEFVYAPTLAHKPIYEDEYEVTDMEDLGPLKIEFSEGFVIFNSTDKFSLRGTTFFISKLSQKVTSACSSCASCSGGCH